MLTKTQKGLLLIAWVMLLASTALLVWFRGYLGRELELQGRVARHEIEKSGVLGDFGSPGLDFNRAERVVDRLKTNVLIENIVLTRRAADIVADEGGDPKHGGIAENPEGREIPIVPYRLAAIASLERRSWNEGLSDWRRVSVRSDQAELGALYIDFREGPLGAINLAIGVAGSGTAAVLAVLVIGLFGVGASSGSGGPGGLGGSRILDKPKGLYQLERYALMGEIASGLIRESRKPVFRIREYISKLRDTLGEVAGASMPLLETENQIGQFLQILDDGDMTALVSRDPGQRQPHDFNQVLRDVLKLTAQAQGDVRITAQYGDDLPSVSAQPQQLVQSLAAALLGILGIMVSRGELLCSTESAGRGVKLSLVTSSPEGEILLSPGAFDPFSAAQASGSGLHLTVCRMIIEEMGGQVDVSAKPGSGVALTLELPAG